MCGAPERLTAFGARTFLYCYHNNNGSESIQLLKPLNKREYMMKFFVAPPSRQIHRMSPDI
jgi:hypothetical protein